MKIQKVTNKLLAILDEENIRYSEPEYYKGKDSQCCTCDFHIGSSTLTFQLDIGEDTSSFDVFYDNQADSVFFENVIYSNHDELKGMIYMQFTEWVESAREVLNIFNKNTSKIEKYIDKIKDLAEDMEMTLEDFIDLRWNFEENKPYEYV